MKISLFDVFKQLLTLHKLTPTSDATSRDFGNLSQMRKVARFNHHAFEATVKPVLGGNSKIDKTRILMTNGSLMKVERIA